MWAGQLGDGRAITLGEVRNNEGQIWELQLKGAGKTPYSRHADGRAVLRSSIREFLASEAFHYLGIPTTRALCVVTSGEEVLRDMFYNGNARMEPGAVVCRMAPTFLRFGSWQIFASRGGVEAGIGRVLADYVIRYHFPHLAHLPEPDDEGVAEGAVTGEEVADGQAVVDLSKNKYSAWFAEVAEKTATLVSYWQTLGFTHGVLNTDNMSVLGLTIDYGPFGFMDYFDPRYTPNTTDLPGRRYSFQQQPDVCLWNVLQLANTLVNLKLMTVEEAQHCISRYADTFWKKYESRMAAKLGLKTYRKDLAQDLFKNLAADKADFTNFFRALSALPISESPESVEMPNPVEIPGELQLLTPLRGALGEISKEREEVWGNWLHRYVLAVQEEGEDGPKRRSAMNRVNPKYILRNHLAQTAIEAAEGGDFSEVRRLLEVLKRPYEEQPGNGTYAENAPEWSKKKGVCMLSCSS